MRSAAAILLGGHLVCAGAATYAGHEGWYRDVLMPLAHVLGAETAHRLAVRAARHHLVPPSRYTDPDSLSTRVWGVRFSNPVGLAAGFDKHGEAVDGMFAVGFGAVEVGSVTPRPQPGNDTPRVFRLREDRAVINRYGFNSVGHDVVYERLKTRKEQNSKGKDESGDRRVPDDRNQLNENFWSPGRPTLGVRDGTQVHTWGTLDYQDF